MLEGETKVFIYYGKRRGRKCYIYIPSSVVTDSKFPFSPGERVKVRIVDKKLVIEKVKR